MGKLSQQTTRSLVIEASSENCSKERREEIRGELMRAIDFTEEDSLYRGPVAITRELFLQATEANPRHLLGLLPMFLMMCGNGVEGEKNLTAKIDWSLV